MGHARGPEHADATRGRLDGTSHVRVRHDGTGREGHRPGVETDSVDEFLGGGNQEVQQEVRE